MFDIAVEQIVKVKPPKTAVIYKALLIIGCIVAATTIPQTRTFGIIVLALFAVMTFLVFQYYNAELEYSMVDDTLTIDRIMAKSARKRCGVYTLSRAKLVARADSQDALRMNHMDVKTYDYSVGASNHDSVVTQKRCGNSVSVTLCNYCNAQQRRKPVCERTEISINLHAS